MTTATTILGLVLEHVPVVDGPWEGGVGKAARSKSASNSSETKPKMIKFEMDVLGGLVKGGCSG